MPETNRIEYKRELHVDVDIEKEVIAFLNYYEGGVIYIGIDKTGDVVGVADADGDGAKDQRPYQKQYFAIGHGLV